MAHALVARHVERLLVGCHHILVLGRGDGSASQTALGRAACHVAIVELQVVAAVLCRLALLSAVVLWVALAALFLKPKTRLVIFPQTFLRRRVGDRIDYVPTAVLPDDYVLLAA